MAGAGAGAGAGAWPASIVALSAVMDVLCQPSRSSESCCRVLSTELELPEAV
jgi:hypothetical protein